MCFDIKACKDRRVASRSPRIIHSFVFREDHTLLLVASSCLPTVVAVKPNPRIACVTLVFGAGSCCQPRKCVLCTALEGRPRLLRADGTHPPLSPAVGLSFAFLAMHLSRCVGDRTADEEAAGADCGCSGGLSRDSTAGTDGGSSSAANARATAEPAAAVAAAGDGSEPEATAARHETAGGDMVFVEAGKFRFGTDSPFIIPVCVVYISARVRAT